MTTSRNHRYLFAPLAAAMGLSEAAAARALNISGSTEQQYRRDGMSERVADRRAVQAGLEPYLVWPEMLNTAIADVERAEQERLDRQRAASARRKRKQYARRRQEILERNRRYRAEARNAIAAQRRRRYAQQAELERERSRRYYEANRERMKEAARRRRAEDRKVA